MSKNSPSQLADRIVVRLPDGLRDQLKELARARHRSVGGQVAAMIEEGIQAINRREALGSALEHRFASVGEIKAASNPVV